MSAIKLPELPTPDTDFEYSRDVNGFSKYEDLWDADSMRAYAEQAVREALAAQVPVAACLPGYGCTIVSTDLDHLDRNGWRGLALIPENDHG